MILGMSAFMSNSRSVQGQLMQMAQSSYYLERASNSAFSSMSATSSKAFTAIKAAALIATGAMAIAGAAASAMALTYNKELAFTGAIAEASSAQVGQLNRAQLQLSRQSTQTALQLNDASTELVKAGFAIEDTTSGILDSVNALVVASNGELQAAKAATLAQVAVASFSKNMRDSNGELIGGAEAVVRAANSATAAVQRSAITFSGFADAMKQGGGMAAQFGMQVEEFAATVGVIGKTIASGTEIGTGLRMMFIRLQNPTDEAIDKMNQYGLSLYDANGAVRPFVDVIADLNRAFGDQAVAAGHLTAQQRDNALAVIFSGRAAKTILPLINGGTEAYLKMLDATQRLKTADLAEAVMRPTANQAKILNNNVAALAIAFGQGLDPAVNSAVTGLVKFSQSIGLEGPEALGRAIGVTVYNAFRNLAEIVQQVVIPVVTPFLQVALPFAAYRAAQAITAAIALKIVALKGWVVATTVAVAASVKGFALASAAAVASAAIHVASAAKIAGAFVGIRIAALLTAAAMSISWAGIGGAAAAGVLAFVSSVSPLLLGLAAIGGAAALLVTAWSSNWGDIQGITARAVGWILQKLNEFLDWLGGLPIIGEHINGLRATVSGFFGEVPRYVTGAKNSLGAFVKSTIDGFAAIKDISIPQMKDYSEELNKLDSELKELEKSSNINLPDVGESEAGEVPGGRDANKAVDAVARAQEAVRDYNRDVRQEVDNTTRAVAELYEKAFADIDKSAKKHSDTIAKTLDEAAKRVEELDANRTIRLDIEARREALTDALDQELKLRENTLEQINYLRDRDLEDEKRAVEASRDFRTRDLEEGLAAQARYRERARQDEDAAFEKSIDARRDAIEVELELFVKTLGDQQKVIENTLASRHKAEKQELDARHDELKRALDLELDARKQNLDDILEAEKEALTTSQKQREQALRDTLDREKEVWESQRELTEIAAEEAAALAKAEQEFQTEIARGVKRSIAEARKTEKLSDIYGSADEKRAALAAREAEAAELRDFEAAQQVRLDALHEQFRAEDEAQEAEHQHRKLELAAQADHAELELDRQMAAQQLDLQRTHEQQVTELRARHERERTEQHRQHETIRRDLDDELEAASLRRSRQRQEEDRLFNREQDDELRRHNEYEDAQALLRDRALKDAERERSKQLELEAEEFRATQAYLRQQLEQQLEQEEHDRRLANIYTERDERLTVAQQTVDEEQEIIRARLAQDIIDFQENMDKRLKTIHENYLDKLDDIVQEGGATLQPLVADIMANMVGGLEAVRQAADLATHSLIDTFNAQEKVKEASEARSAARAQVSDSGVPQIGGFDWGAYNAAKNSGASDAEARRKAEGRGAGRPVVGGDIATSSSAEAALKKAQANLGAQEWNWMCQKFVENMFGTGGRYPSAVAAANALMTNRGGVPPRGSLVFFAPDKTNGFFGHVGISKGGGTFISATSNGVRDDSIHDKYWGSLYQGYGPPRFKRGVTNFDGGLAYVHQNELLVNLPKGTSVVPSRQVSATLAAVRAAESLSRSGVGGASSISNSYQYSVNANYGRVQPEGSVRRDLSALIALTKR